MQPSDAVKVLRALQTYDGRAYVDDQDVIAIEQGAEAIELLAWLKESEMPIVCRREKTEDGWAVWWTCLRRHDSRSVTHPYGSPLEAIRAAKNEAAKGPTR